MIQIEDYLYFTRKTYLKDNDSFEQKIFRIKPDGSDEELVYTFQSPWAQCRLLKLNSSKQLYFMTFMPEGSYESEAGILNLDTKEVKTFYEAMDDVIYYDDMLYYLKPLSSYIKPYEGDKLYKTDLDFNETLLQENVGRFQIYKNKIAYTNYNDTKKAWSLLSCDLNGGGSSELVSAGLEERSFSIHNDVIYAFSKGDTETIETIDLLSGDMESRTPKFSVTQIQYTPDCFITHDLTGKIIYKISYDWKIVEKIAEYYCDIDLIGDYLYLLPDEDDFGYGDDNYEKYAISGAIYRIRLDGSGFEKFVQL
ncbi:MAG: hypothetical protein GX107_07700, partial [Clostridiales bacterium]|nr:hypothetical protein [Clostridiales bacterium]